MYNVHNTVTLINDLKELDYKNQIKLASLDISNMYMNIPTTEII